MVTVAVLDYGVGNVHSVCRMVESAGAAVTLTNDASIVQSADGVVVPGVGDFAAVMDALYAHHGDRMIRHRLEAKKPIFGICVGLQILFESSQERDAHVGGLGVFPGDITRITSDIIPHMGWSRVEGGPSSTLMNGVSGNHFYFAHSYAAHDINAARGSGAIVSTCHAGSDFIAAIESADGLVCATQFHPEKSSQSGRQVITNWLHTL